MAKKTYSDDEKAEVVALLEVNNGNVARTAKDTGVAEQTIRDWKKTWDRSGVPAKVQAAAPQAFENFADRAEGIREKMLDNLEAKVLNDELNPQQLIVGIGVLTDKLRVSRGEVTSRTATEVSNAPSADEIGKAVFGYLGRAVSQSQERDGEIVDAEWSEQAPQGELQTAQLPT